MSKQYIIRTSDGIESSPMSQDEVINRIRKNQITGKDEIAAQPGHDFVLIKSLSIFEGALQEASEGEDEKTTIFDKNKFKIDPEKEKTRLFSDLTRSHKIENSAPVEQVKKYVPLSEFEDLVDPKSQREKTQIFTKPIDFPEAATKKKGFTVPKKSFLVMILLALLGYEMAFEDDEDEVKPHEVLMKPVRPQLPGGGAGAVDPERSMMIYNAVIKTYMQDTVKGYRKAIDGFQLSLRADPQNVKALAMLASTYINLIDSSNKDENTYSVINKLIELSRVGEVNLVETLIADVEFLAMSRRYDAAIQRLIEYYKVSGKIDPILYYYLGWLHSLKNESANALKYLNQIPASALPMPKLYYLRGWLLEENKEYDEAKIEYQRALKLNPHHAKSILGVIRVNEKKGEIKNVSRHIEFLISTASLLSPPEFVQVLIYRSKLALVYHQPEQAVKSLREALSIEPKNEDIKLEYYTLLSQAEQNTKYKELAKMYALVLEGERLMRKQQYHEATLAILQAKDAFPKSEVPLEKMGDLFYETGEYQKALTNFKKALEINKKSGEIAIKLINSLIKNHDYEDAQKYLAQYRSHPKLKSSIDRLAGDLAYQQGYFPQAIQFYRKAMARDTIDTDVYASYANTLRELDQCKDAQFFYTLSQRLDPFNYSAIINSAKCFLKTDSVDIAVGRIQEELSKSLKVRADLLTGIAEVYYIANDYDRALQFTAQAKEVDPDYPDLYKVEGEIYLKQMVVKKEYEKKALESLKAYSDRKISDPFGYLQRFDIFVKESNFEAADAELNRIFEVSPRFPELHFRRAQLLMKKGRVKEALHELEEELKFNPRLVKAMVESANIFVRLNNLDDAMKSYVKAMELDPLNAQAKLGAGFVNYLKRQFPSAIALYNAALAIDRGNPEIYKKLGLAYRDSGDMQNAGKAFRNYLDLAPDAPDRNEYERYR